MILNVSRELLDLGLASAVVVARGVVNTRSTREFSAYRRRAAKKIAGHWKNRSISADPAIREYHRLHAKCGVVDEPPAPEKLIMFVRRNQDFTSAGAVVDCYNIVSAKTLLSIGAHDFDQLDMPVDLRTCTADDVFIPLGRTIQRPVTGEYGYVDSKKRVICRLDVLQCEYSKTTPASRDIVFFLQGNRCLSAGALLKGCWLLVEMIERFAGGEAEIVDFFDPGGSKASTLSKPHIVFDDFQQLDLRKGVVTRFEAIPGMPALSQVEVAAGTTVNALTPTSNLPAQAIGQPVIVANGLHPLTVGAHQYRAYLMTVNAADAASTLTMESQIPNGMKLY